MCSSELFCLASASANDKAWKACSEPSLACRILPNITPLPRSFNLAGNARERRRLRIRRRLRLGSCGGQQVARQIEGGGDQGGNGPRRGDGGGPRPGTGPGGGPPPATQKAPKPPQSYSR